MDALEFLEQTSIASPAALYVVTGDEPFLKRQALAALRERLLGRGDDAFALSKYTGDRATLGEVMADVATLPFLAARRLVVVEEADAFVSKYRSQLEKYLGK